MRLNKWEIILRRFLGHLVLLSLVFPLNLFAVEPPTSTEVLDLPEPEQVERRVILSGANLRGFKHLLLEPISAWVENQQFTTQLLSRTHEWKFPKFFLSAPETNKIDSSGNLILAPSDENTAPSIPFLTEQHIDTESSDQIKAYKILWNSTYVQSLAAEARYDFELTWIGSDSALRSSNGMLYRWWFPQAEQMQGLSLIEEQPAEKTETTEIQLPSSREVKKDNLLYSELFQLNSPAAVFGFAQILWRYADQTLGRVWAHSPVIGKNREIHLANRSDPILEGVLTPEDFFVFSGKISRFKARVVAQKDLLVPMALKHPVQFSQAPSEAPRGGRGEALQQLPSGLPAARTTEQNDLLRGVYQRLDGSTSMALMNFETGQYSGFAPWISSSSFLVPRAVWIIELYSRDPFYQSGRELLVIDRESFLPMYKIVYDHRGDFKRFVFGAWGLGRSAGEEHLVPFLAYSIAVHGTGRMASSMVTNSVTVALGDSGLPTRPLVAIENHGLIEAEEDLSEEETVEDGVVAPYGELPQSQAPPSQAPQSQAPQPVLQ